MTDNYDKVSLLLPMNGANNGTVFTDWSPVPNVVTRVNSAVTTTSQSKYYGSAADLTGSKRLSIASNDLITVSGQNFTVENWVYVTALSGVIFSKWNATSTGRSWRLDITSSTQLRLLLSTTGSGISLDQSFDHGMSINTWHHVALSRSGDDYKVFVDGNEKTSQSLSGDLYNNSNTALFISNDASELNTCTCYINDFRMKVGEALYTTDFTPPTRLLGTISNTAVGAAKTLDAAGNPAERTVIAVPRSAPTRVWSTVSNASGEFEIQAPVGVEHSVVALADETSLYNDIVHRVIPV